jgi:DNA modification methylase
MLTPYYQDEFITLYNGDVREILPHLPAGIAQTCVTSPPYFGLRDYGTATWSGGQQDCDHVNSRGQQGPSGQRADRSFTQPVIYKNECGKCGAVRIDNQIGLEATPADFIETMVDLFGQIKRVLRSDGTVWLNLGDSYNGQGARPPNIQANGDLSYRAGGLGMNVAGLKPKDLMMMPHRVAIALQDAGWWVRQDIVWQKPNPMPESVADRCTKAHEYIFHLAASERYFFDAEAIKEPSAPPTGGRQRAALNGNGKYIGADFKDYHDGRTGRHQEYQPLTRNKRSVWSIATQPFPEAHFATFPSELPETCIKAGSSEKGQCCSCGKPFERIVEKTGGTTGKGWHDHSNDLQCGQRGGTAVRAGLEDYKVETVGWKPSGRDRSFNWSRNGLEGSGSTLDGNIPQKRTAGWESCCDGSSIEPQTVLEPFAGAGTTLIVAKVLGRRAIGIELNPEYCEMIVRRIKAETELPLFDSTPAAEGEEEI